jgi:VIT1/CCC1 family predicted Fe2+/Mn2+ transporter
MLAAVSSFFAFTVGAILPVFPYLVGSTVLWPAMLVSLIALFVCGAVVTSVTNRHWIYGGVRQLLLGAAAAALTYGFGYLVGGTSLG